MLAVLNQYEDHDGSFVQMFYLSSLTVSIFIKEQSYRAPEGPHQVQMIKTSLDPFLTRHRNYSHYLSILYLRIRVMLPGILSGVLELFAESVECILQIVLGQSKYRINDTHMYRGIR